MHFKTKEQTFVKKYWQKPLGIWNGMKDIYIYVLKGDMHLGKKLLSEKFPTLDQDHSQK